MADQNLQLCSTPCGSCGPSARGPWDKAPKILGVSRQGTCYVGHETWLFGPPKKPTVTSLEVFSVFLLGMFSRTPIELPKYIDVNKMFSIKLRSQFSIWRSLAKTVSAYEFRSAGEGSWEGKASNGRAWNTAHASGTEMSAGDIRKIIIWWFSTLNFLSILFSGQKKRNFKYLKSTNQSQSDGDGEPEMAASVP